MFFAASVEEGISIFNPLLVTHRSVKKQKVQPKESAKSGIPAEEVNCPLFHVDMTPSSKLVFSFR